MQVLDFIVNNWQYISIALVVLLDIIILIVKNRPKRFDEINDIISQCIAKIPAFIQDAESLGDYDGADKKSLVVGWLFQFIENTLKRAPSASEEQYIYKALSYYIEAILDCPTKKGGFGREQD